MSTPLTRSELAAVKRTLWSKGSLTWKLRPEQRRFKAEIENAGKQLIVGNISRRWGKSFTLVLYALEQALKSKQKIRYAAAFKSDLEEFILPAFEIILEDCPAHLRPEYIASKQVWRFKNGSSIKLVGLDKNRNGLRGNAINIIILDEAGFIANLKYQYTTVIIPATAKQKNIKIIVISTPPESPEHYFVEMIRRAQVQSNGYYLCLTIDDISDLDPSERKRLLDEVGGEQSTTAQREFFCRIIIDADRAIAPSFQPRHVAKLTTDHIKWGLFGDSGGVRDLTVFLEAGYSHDLGKVIMRDELWFPKGTPTSVIVQSVKERWPNHLTLILDAAGQLLIDYASLGLPAALPQKDDFGAGLLLLNNAFHNDRAVIDPSCALLVRTVEGGMLNKQRSDYERTESLGHCDAAAAAIYALRCCDRITDLRPKPNPESVFKIKQDPPHLKQLKGMTYAR
jgi:hypothetical protein